MLRKNATATFQVFCDLWIWVKDVETAITEHLEWNNNVGSGIELCMLHICICTYTQIPFTFIYLTIHKNRNFATKQTQNPHKTNI